MTDQRQILAIHDRIFDVSSATFGSILALDEDIGWRFQWYFDFETVAREFDGEAWHPRLYAEALFLSLPPPNMLSGYALDVPDPYNDAGDPNFTLCVFEHEPAWDMRITFGRWRGEGVDANVLGKADVRWSEPFDTAVPIRVECRTLFEGINVWDHSEDSARSRLAAFYNPANFMVERARVGFNFRLRANRD